MNPEEKIITAVENKINLAPPSKHIWKKITVVVLVLIIFLGVTLGASAAYLKIYQGKVYPGVYVGQYHLGGMKAEAVVDFAETINNRLSKEGIDLKVKTLTGAEEKIKISTVLAGDISLELIKIDSAALAEQSVAIGRTGAWWQKLLSPWYYRFFVKQHSAAPLKINEPGWQAVLVSNLNGFSNQPHNAKIVVDDLSSFKYHVIPESAGWDFVYENISTEIKTNVSNLVFDIIPVAMVNFSPQVVKIEAESAAALLPVVFNYGNLGLNYIDPQTKQRHDWNITSAELASWLVVEKDGGNTVILSLEEDGVKKYLENLRAAVDRPAQEAKFSMVNGKVKEFVASQSGIGLNTDKTYQDLVAAFRERNYHPVEAVKTISLSVDVTEPKVKMSDVNNLGVSEIIGVGISTFKGSHTNRIKNIARAVQLLNGTLIQPGEEFSSNHYAGPYTLENGFYPELVIKGREIKSEVGGGMCQIGTTLFRMAMNSGMDITERHNHSLVVSYYGDPVNGNPGTDAALYDPVLDLKFKNDTGHYLLLQTAIDYKKQQLTFTLWGTNDGRKGWYTHPTVSKWIPSGEPQEVKTTKLKPGEKECQDAYRGAVASFIYSRVTPNGEKVDRVFDSYYRPLPRICMIGEEEKKPDGGCPAGEICNNENIDGTNSSVVDGVENKTVEQNVNASGTAAVVAP